MPRLRWLAGPLAFLPGLVPAIACSNEPPATVGLVFRDTQGIVADATSMRLSVAAAEAAACQPTGHVDVPGDAQTFQLDKAGCPDGSWCKTIELDRDGSNKTFAVVAEDASGILGEGCATTKVDQDPLEVSIKIQRYNPPKCCADGTLQAGEQCECGVGISACQTSPTCGTMTEDEVCWPDCVSKEIPISQAKDAAFPAPNVMTRLAMAFCPGDAEIANGLRAVFTETSGTATGGADVLVRALTQQLYSVEGSSLSKPLRIPLLCSNPIGAGTARKQDAASIAPFAADMTAIVYTSDEATGAKTDIFLSPQTKVGCRDKQAADAAAAQLNTTGTPATDPDVAGGPVGYALTVWTESGQVHGRIFQQSAGSPPWTLIPAASDIVISTSGSAARVAGTSTGFIVAYQGSGTGDGDGIFTKRVDLAGTAGAETKVNAATTGAQDQPDIASLPDGRFVVAWRNGGDIFAQRFDASGAALAGDQDGPIHVVVDGEQAHPAVAGFGNTFTVAWDSSDGNIVARYLGADGGFLYNTVNGQNEEFAATLPGVSGARTLPAVAMGGGGWVAIGWQDPSPEHAGIFVRRFPLPTE